MKEIECKIYLKSRKKPIEFVLSSNAKLNELLEGLNNKKVVKLGPIMFSSDEFLYAISDEK